MATQPTREELRTACKRKGDRVNASTPSDDEWNEWINESAAELWDEVVTCYEDQYTESTTVSVSSSTSVDGYFKIRSVEINIDGRYMPIELVPLAEWGKYAGVLTSNIARGYTVIGDTLHLLPEGTTASVRVRYVPEYTTLSADGDVLFRTPSNWHEYIVIDCLIKMRAKFQEDASQEFARKAAILDRIKKAASNRMPGGSKRVIERATHRDG